VLRHGTADAHAARAGTPASCWLQRLHPCECVLNPGPAGGAARPAGHHQGDGADRDAARGVRNGRDPVRAAAGRRSLC
jgi:hypothetical protein